MFRAKTVIVDGIVYVRKAWTGGDAPPHNIQETARFKVITDIYYQEQLKDFSDYWGDQPNEDTKQLFLNRAKYDAWATLRDTVTSSAEKIQKGAEQPNESSKVESSREER